MSDIKPDEDLSAREILHKLESHRDLSDTIRLRLEVFFHSRLAAPFTCLIVALIGVPIGAHTGRRGAFAGICVAVGLFFVFYMLMIGARALGQKEVLSPLLAGWLSVMVFGAISPFMIFRMR